MDSFYLNTNQVEWIKRNLRGYAEHFKVNIEKIYVRDSGGYLFRNMELYFMKDQDNFMTTRCSISSDGISWDNPMPMMLLGIIQDMLKNRPRILREGASEFMDLQGFVEKN